MIFQHTHEKVLSGEKTQTRRLIVPDPKVGIGRWYKHDTYLDYWDEERPFPGEGVYTIRGREGGWLSGDACVEPEWDYTAKYIIGHDYAVQPGRGKASIARIRITGIRREDVREISREDALAEGFENEADFLWTWCSMHDKPVWFRFDWKMVDWRLRIGRKQQGLVGWDTVIDTLRTRPNDRYQAWVIEFALVEGGAG